MNKYLKRPLKEVNIHLLDILMDAVPDTGVFVEFGVLFGFSFKVIYERGLKQGRTVHAVDTFKGLPRSPIETDNERYRPGAAHGLNVHDFRLRFPETVIHHGEVPGILKDIEIEKIAFAHLDIDHEYSTYAALHWTWERMVDGGIIIIHDYGRPTTTCASAAVKRWMKELELDYVGICDNTIFFKKGVS